MTRPHISQEETLESLGPYFFVQRKAGHRLTSDTVALAEFVVPALTGKDTVIDIGTGTAAVPLILAWKSDARSITGVEIDEGAFASANKNIRANGLEARVSAVNRDYRELKEVFGKGSFSAVVSNPPYIKAGAGRVSPGRERAAARAEVFGTLTDLISISAWLAGKSGRVYYVFPVERIAEMLEGLGKAGLKPRRLRFLRTKEGGRPALFLVEAAGEGGLTVETAPG